jgi:ribonuclease HI
MQVKIEWKFTQSKKPSTIFYSDWLPAGEAIVIMEDLEKTGRAYEIEFQDEIGTVWTKKELKKLLEETKEEPQDVMVYFDGGYLKEEGMAASGLVIYYSQNGRKLRLRMNKVLEGLSSNNEAEYAAFYDGVLALEDLGVHHQAVTFKGDSQVVLNQLAGDWPCFEDEFNKWLDRIEEKLQVLSIHPKYEPISRKLNSEADKLATQALQGTIIKSTLEI